MRKILEHYMIPYDVTITKHFRPSEAAFVTIENKTESE
jgi:hypothetical protein